MCTNMQSEKRSGRPKEYDEIKILCMFVTVKCLKYVVNLIIKIDQID